MRSRHLLALIAALLCATAHARTGEHPNLLLIVSDDQQPDAIGAFGRVPVVTPALDSLVARGKTFRRAYCMGSFSAAVCAPSRAMLLTGDTVHQLPPGPYNLAGPDRSWWPERLRERGYQTFGTGKWHNGRAAFQRCVSANLLYMRNKSPEKIAASSPPVPARISKKTLLLSFGSLGSSKHCNSFSIC